MSVLEQAIRKNLKFNVIVNLLDGAFFGLGWGFGSIGTIIPLFVSRLTDSAVLIGLIPAIHAVTWQFPQLFMANPVSRLRRYRPMVMWLTIHERIPYLGFAAVAFFAGMLGNRIALVLSFALLVWQGLGAGFTANAWQSMIAKIIPGEARGTFFGAQASVANILMSFAAVAAGFILEKVAAPLNFTWCFLLVMTGLIPSFVFLGMTREPLDTEKVIPERTPSIWKGAGDILRKDRNFVTFLAIRLLSQFATMGFAFYILYGLRRFNMDTVTAGFLTASVTITQTIANPAMGWLGDRIGHRAMLILGSFAVTISAAIAWAAPNIGWMYPAFILSSLANVAYWTNTMVLSTQFGSEETRPVYIGLTNTLVAPATFLAPLVGGWIVDAASFQATFMVSIIGGLVIAVLLFWLMRDPRGHQQVT
jgi:MFS family permease